MRRLLTGAVDAEVADTSLRVIAAFDDLVAEGGTLQQLTDLAAAMLGREVYLRDDLLDRLVRAGAATEADLARLDQLAWQLGSRVERGRQAVAVDLDDRQFLAAGIEHAGGRLGTAWTERPDATGIAAEELVMERLTSAAAARILQDHDAVRPQEAGSTESLERLLAGDFSGDGLVGMARRARTSTAATGWSSWRAGRRA